MIRFLAVTSLVLTVGSAAAQVLELSEHERLAFQEQAQEKVNALSNNIRVLCDKSKSPSDKEDAMLMALKLFIDEHQIVETSSKSTGEVKKERVSQYLNRLRILPYKQVVVEWFDIQYTSELRKGRDGKYYGTMTIFQKFTGFGPEGDVLYEDFTQKNISVAVDTEIIRIGDRVMESPTVKLGNISVVETK